MYSLGAESHVNAAQTNEPASRTRRLQMRKRRFCLAIPAPVPERSLPVQLSRGANIELAIACSVPNLLAF